jgi:hypothetical protein
MLHRRLTRRVVLVFFALAMTGCQSPYIRWPNFSHPGTAEQQRADAERFDPFPDPEAGPEVVGGRPLGYTRPFSDVEWGRRFAPPPGGIPPALPVVPSVPVYTNPFPSAALPAPPAPAISSQIQPRGPY